MTEDKGEGHSELAPLSPDRLALIRIATGICFVLLAVAWGSIFVVGLSRDLWLKAIQGNFAAMIMLPIACGFSLVVVLVLRMTAGDLKFKALGFEFEGASGPVVLWVLCFLAQILGIYLLWFPQP